MDTPDSLGALSDGHDCGLAKPVPLEKLHAMTRFRTFMHIALAQARAAGLRGEVPVGAVIVSASGEVVAEAGNRTREWNDPTAHAEMLAIRAACAALGQERLTGHDLYVTLEPCPMCAMAISHARIARLYFGAADPKTGGVGQGPRIFDHPQCHHVPEVYDGIDADAAQALLQDFFARLR
ncbi:tRNA(Arg) A34 adenosine deaminase TadA [Roseinatronobacter monicus]|uniref:tRNA-specific adenosine deaminase n=2 Tax=Roseinatronobacter monicus TaxID=393481 RepID=A0A543KDZ2_9RHOB|nr:tRNA(Arg) A34 adenosine deaminase TadA [Roseinatronobacter monicus]